MKMQQGSSKPVIAGQLSCDAPALEQGCVCVGLCVLRYLAFVVRGRDVHLLLHHVVNVGGGAALDPFFLLPLELVSHHLDSLRPLISEHKFKQLYRLTSGKPHLQPTILHREDNKIDKWPSMETLERTSTVDYMMLANSAALTLFKIHKGI